MMFLRLLFSILLLFPFVQSVHAQEVTEQELLQNPFHLVGIDGATEASQPVTVSLPGKTTVRLTYDLHGTCLRDGDASAIIFDQPTGNWHYASLSQYGKNCLNGVQTAEIPLQNFAGLDTNGTTNLFHVRFWHEGPYTIDITSVVLLSLPTDTVTPSPTSTPTPLPTISPMPPTTGSWPIRSVSTMKETKDKVCGPDTQTFINKFVQKAKELGVNYVAVETPYDNPACGNSLAYTQRWVNTIHNNGLLVWHRHMPLAFEGIYGVSKTKKDFLSQITAYIKNNPSLFKPGDIFSPIPEPQNGGIQNITYCAASLCQFTSASDFNKWLRDSMQVSDAAFASIGRRNQIKIGYFGFDGFVAWGDNNPDWHGILEDTTIAMMGNITIDHYPEAVSDTMQNDLNELEARYPGIPIVIGEWGTITGGNIEQQVKDSMKAAKRPSVVGFNYWHMGMGGNEALINTDFTNRSQFDEVQLFFKP